MLQCHCVTRLGQAHDNFGKRLRASPCANRSSYIVLMPSYPDDGIATAFPYPAARTPTSTAAAAVCGSGTGSPCSLRLSIWKAMASRISLNNSSLVLPVATHPGRSGT